MVVEGLSRYINTLGFIPYEPYFVIPFKLIVKLSPIPVVFSYQGFHVSLVFFLYFVFLYCVLDHNKWYQSH